MDSFAITTIYDNVPTLVLNAVNDNLYFNLNLRQPPIHILKFPEDQFEFDWMFLKFIKSIWDFFISWHEQGIIKKEEIKERVLETINFLYLTVSEIDKIKIRRHRKLA